VLSEEEIVGGWQWAVGREEEESAECQGKKKGRELAVGGWQGRKRVLSEEGIVGGWEGGVFYRYYRHLS
jgi:hypothetical protein